ncbi:uncharacterized protein LOC118739773 [Rhagoletis pomonella]|uniref:uncharacterized protein LOC118739773 n=1 Tax=Rhagoletis pomonella TaxID=28610 RepID=UPI00177BB6B5|nr:uncharacterized protein LOC118739773 [Rhagoletis pomonella]
MNRETINAEKYSLLQLKAWCAAVGLNASGAKASLAARLSELSAEARGLCPGAVDVPGGDSVPEKRGAKATVPPNVDGGDGTAKEKNNGDGPTNGNDANNGGGTTSDKGANNGDGERGNDGANNDDDGDFTNDSNGANNDGVNNNNCAYNNDGAYDNDGAYNNDGAYGNDGANRGSGEERREFSQEIVSVTNELGCGPDNTREFDGTRISLLEKEIELLKLKLELQQGGAKLRVAADNAKPGLETMKELMPDYDGSEDFEMWRSQLLHFQRVLQVSDEALSLVVRLKMKGEALMWYNSNKMFMRTVGEILADMEVVFGKKDNILNARRKFERRIWKFGEQFGSYANEKRLLSAGLNLCEEEFVEYLVDGIPNKQLQIQAKLQNFKSAGEVTRAFRTVELPRRVAPKTNIQSGQERLRCYNCNCSGHVAKE